MSPKPNSKTVSYEFGKRLLELREKVGLTQIALAHLIGLTNRSIISWETGQSYPRVNNLIRLVETFVDKKGFTPQREHSEAQYLWEKATHNNQDSKNAFNSEWFNKLLHQTKTPAKNLLPRQSELELHRQDWSESVNDQVLFGREDDIAVLENWLLNEACPHQVIGIFGLGGIGKTGLAVRLANKVTSLFNFVIIRTLRNAPPLEELLDSILRFFLNGQLENLPVQSGEKLTMVMDFFRNYRCLLVLDNFETILGEGLKAGDYRDGYFHYGDFIRGVCEIPHKSCLLITSREKPQQLGQWEGTTGTVRSLTLKGLDMQSCQAVLKNMAIVSDNEQLAFLTERYGGNPLALKLIADPIQRFFGGDTGAFLDSDISRIGNVNFLLDKQFDRLSSVEQDILYWLAISREPLDLQTLQKRITQGSGGSGRAFSEGISALGRRFLIEQISGSLSFTLQGVVIEYFTEQLVNRIFNEIIEGKPNLLCRYPLLQTQTRQFIRQTQLKLVIEPLLAQLRNYFLTEEEVKQGLTNLLKKLRRLPIYKQRYAGGNILNLLVQAGIDLLNWDFSSLNLWQAVLTGVNLHGVNLAGSDLTGSLFTEANLRAYSLAFSPEGKRLAIGCANGSIKIWQVGKLFGSQLLECRGHTDLVSTVSFSPDGAILASGSVDGSVRLWETASGTCLGILRGPEPDAFFAIRSVVFSPDGQWLAISGFDQTICLWQLSNLRMVTTLKADQGWVMAIGFSPDSKRLASGGLNKTIKIWDVSTPEQDIKLISTLSGHDQWVSSLAFNPAGNLLASGSADQTVGLWSLETSTRLATLNRSNGMVMGVTFSPDGKLLASNGTDSIVRFWEVFNTSIERNVFVSKGEVTALAFNPDGQTFVTSSGEISNLNLWSLANLEILDTIHGYSNSIQAIAMDNKGEWLAAGGMEPDLLLWNLTKPFQNNFPFLLKGHGGPVRSVAFSANGETVASGSIDATIKLWSLESKKCRLTLRNDKNPITALIFSPDSKLLISGDEEGILTLWSAVNGQKLSSLVAHQYRIRDLIFSPDGQTLASAAEQGQGLIKLWEVNSEMAAIQQTSCWSSQNDLVIELAFNFDGSMLFGVGSGGKLQSWDVRTSQSIDIINAHEGLVWAMVYDPVNQKIATAGEDGFLKIWDIDPANQFRLVESFEHFSKTKTLAFTRNGDQIFSAGDDGRIKLWNLKTETIAAVLSLQPPYKDLNISGVTGITQAQKYNLLGLEAITEDNSSPLHAAGNLTQRN